MRALLAVMLLATPALSDSRTRALATGYTKELTACKRSADGVRKVATGAQQLVDSGAKEYAVELDALHAGLDQVDAYCAELDATLQLIADPNVAYKPLEHQLDDHDNKVRRLRAGSKKALDTLGSVISKLVPVINARVGTPEPSTKRTPIKFPSGRSIDAPTLPGSWKVAGSGATDTVEYAEGKASSTISVQAITGTCADQKRSIASWSVDEPRTEGTKDLTWYVGYARDARRVRMACRDGKAGSVLGKIDDPAAAKWPQLEMVLTAMLATRDSK